MLKPKRKITRKEIKVDPMLETLANIQKHIETYKNTYIRYAAGLIVVIAALIVFSNKRATAQEEANAALGRALIVWEQKDWDNAEFQFELLADEYGQVKTGKLGYYYLGLIQLKKGNKDGAIAAFKQFVSDNDYPMLESNAQLQLAKLYKANGDFTTAIKHLRKVEKLDCPLNQKQSARLQLAELLLNAGNVDEAEDLVNQVLSAEVTSDYNKNKAQQLFGRITG